MNSNDSGATKIHDLLESFSTAMLVTHCGGDSLRARPMMIAQLEDDCGLWFVTGKQGSAASEIASDHEAHVICQKEKSEYLSIKGIASLISDRAKLEELWREPFRVWFPGGKDDPNIVLISFRPELAEFWDNSGFNKIEYLWEAARAYVSGQTPDIKEGEQHGVVSLS